MQAVRRNLCSSLRRACKSRIQSVDYSSLQSGVSGLRLLGNTSACLPRAALSSPLPSIATQQVRGMANHRHKKIIKLAKGFRGRGKNVYSVAYRRVLKARQYAYRDRKVKKREFRKLWIMRINAAARIHGTKYSHLVRDLAKANIILDRKILADLAITEPLSFMSVVKVAEKA